MTKSMKKSYDEFDINESWKTKFRIFDKAGSWNGLTFQNYKLLSFKERRKISLNFIAFLFGSFYYFSKKMYHKGAFLLGISLIYSSILITIEQYTNIVIYQSIYLLPVIIIATIANYDYYKFITKKEKMWNKFPNFLSTTFGSISFVIISLLLYLSTLGVFNNINIITSKIKSSNMLLYTQKSENNYIKLVKDSTMHFNKTLTVGEALDNWKNCKSKKWEHFKTDNGVNVVEFTCSQKNIKEFTYKLKNLLQNKEQKDTAFLDIESSTQIFQFTINKDDTFQIDNVQVETIWNDGSKYSDSLNQMESLERAYDNEITFDITELDKITINDLIYVLKVFENIWLNRTKPVETTSGSFAHPKIPESYYTYYLNKGQD